MDLLERMPSGRLIIAGSRNFNDFALLSQQVTQYIHECDFTMNNLEIVSGGARGADTLGERYAKEHSLPFFRCEAEWDKYGRAAGPIRNEKMAKYATHLIAFLGNNSRGTQNMINQAKKIGIPYKVITI